MIFKIRLMYLEYFIVFLLLLGFNREAQATTFLEKALEAFVSCVGVGEAKAISGVLKIPHGELRELEVKKCVLTKEQLEKVNEFSQAIPNGFVSYEGERIYNRHLTAVEYVKAVEYDENGVRIIVVADGHVDNEISIQLTDRQNGIAPFLCSLMKAGSDICNPEILTTAFLAYNKTLQQEGKKGGSTCTLLIDKKGGELIIASVGDSPCMTFTPQGQILTTKDHTAKKVVEVDRVNSITDAKYKVSPPNRDFEYFSFPKHGVEYCEADEDDGDTTINISRTFGDEFRLLPIPDVAKIPRENVSILALFSDRLRRSRIITMLTESSPDNMKEGFNKVFPAEDILPCDATVVFYNPNISRICGALSRLKI